MKVSMKIFATGLFSFGIQIIAHLGIRTPERIVEMSRVTDKKMFA